MVPPKRKGPNANLPPRLHLKSGAYYYVTTAKPRKWIKLSKDKAEAFRKWAELEGRDIAAGTFQAAWEAYEREIVPAKALRTQKDNRQEAKYLLKVFGEMALDDIAPEHVKQYLKIRTAKIRGTREKALLSHVFNFARGEGMTSAPNPCAGIKGATTGRNRYVSDDEFMAVWDEACPPLRDCMDLALLTGQRPGDLLKLRHTDIRDGSIWICQSKTGQRLRISIEGELKALIDRCKARASTYPVTCLHLIVSERGQPVPYWTMRAMFDRARKAARGDWQFRDIRAKTATDLDDLGAAQKLLAHKRREMTERYVRARMGEKVRPLR